MISKWFCSTPSHQLDSVKYTFTPSWQWKWVPRVPRCAIQLNSSAFKYSPTRASPKYLSCTQCQSFTANNTISVGEDNATQSSLGRRLSWSAPASSETVHETPFVSYFSISVHQRYIIPATKESFLQCTSSPLMTPMSGPTANSIFTQNALLIANAELIPIYLRKSTLAQIPNYSRVLGFLKFREWWSPFTHCHAVRTMIILHVCICWLISVLLHRQRIRYLYELGKVRWFPIFRVRIFFHESLAIGWCMYRNQNVRQNVKWNYLNKVK